MSRRIGLALLAVAALVSAGAFVLDSGRSHAGDPLRTVNTTDIDDDGSCDNLGPGEDCTLLEALNSAATTSDTTIAFDIPGCPPACTIAVDFQLPAISEHHTTIDGTTQPGYVDEPLIAIDGAATQMVSGQQHGLRISAGGDDTIIRGLKIRSFNHKGIRTTSGDTTGLLAENNFILSNLHDGMDVRGTGHTIRDNLIAGNGGFGIIGPQGGSTIEGNIIQSSGAGGIRATGGGTIDIIDNILQTNQGDGISAPFLSESAISGNLIEGNGQQGLSVSGDGVTIFNNTITDNEWNGIVVASGGLHASTITQNEVTENDLYGFRNGGSDSLIITGNLFADNGRTGLWLVGDQLEIDENTVTGNGQSDFPFQNYGIRLEGTDMFLEGNTVSGNIGDGIRVRSGSDIRIGGDSLGEENDINGNGGAGVSIFGPGVEEAAGGGGNAGFEQAPAGVRILRNTLANNGGLGIDNGFPGVDTNDLGDPDAGGNNL